MQPIRICQLITELKLSGAERVVYELARRLDRRRFDVRVAALRGGAVEGMLAAVGIPTFVLGVRGRWDVFKLRRLARWLREQRIALLHTHLFHADLAGRLAARSAGVPHLVHTVHVAEQRWRPWQFAFARWTADRCDRLVCVSQSVLEHHAAKSRLPLARYAVIPNGVDAPAFARQADARARLRRAWGIGDDEVCVLFVGRLDRQKGIDVLLDAAALAKRPDIHVVIAGDGPLRPMVENGDWLRFRRLKSEPVPSYVPLYVGFVDDVPAALSAADLFVLPSRWEGWPLALAEAMAGGLPCVGTDSPGIRDVIDSGRTGLLVPPENAAVLAEAIQRLAGDPALRQSLGTAAAREIAEKYSIQRNIAAHEDLYRQVMER